MGLDISLIKIVNQPTNKWDALVVDDTPELKSRYEEFITFDKDWGCEVYYYNEISHQRKGVIEEYYNDYDFNETVFTNEELFRLRGYIDDENIQNFEENFMKKFVEGENIILVSR